MKNLQAIAALVLVLGGCGVQLANAPAVPNPGAAAAPNPLKAEPPAVNMARLKLQACGLLTPTERCRDYRNMLGRGLAVMVLRVNNVPIMITPYGGRMPLPRLLFQESTPLPLLGCDRPGYDANNNRFCRFTIVADAYPTAEMPTIGTAAGARMGGLNTVPIVDPAYRQCFMVEVHVYDDSSIMDPISHHRVFDKVPCPNNFVPATAVQTPQDSEPPGTPSPNS